MQSLRIRNTARALRQQDRSEILDSLRLSVSPTLFASEVLGIECWDRQAVAMSAVTDSNRVAIRSGHKVGKSALAAALALWWACTRARAGVVLTAPTSRQVKRILWKELTAMARRSRIPLPSVPRDPGTGIQWADGRYIVGFSTDEPENMGGFSGPEMLFIVDEASGVDDTIFEAIEGNLAGGSHDGSGAVAKIVLLGNPTRTSGYFYDAFHNDSAIWNRHHISSEDSPNVLAGRVVIPGLATQHYVEERKATWGPRSPLYQIRVSGDFPAQGSDAVISLASVCAAIDRWSDTSAEGRLQVGVDVARFGDDESCVVVRRGIKVLELECHVGFDEVEVAGMVISTVMRHYRKGERHPQVKVDSTGVGGGVASILKRDDRLEVAEVCAAEKALDEEMFPNVRSELWFAIAVWLDEGGALPDDPKLQRDLLAPNYSFDARGRRVVEKKEKLKSRLGRSPDRADALALSIYRPPEGAFFIPEKRHGLQYRYEPAMRGYG